MRFLKIVIITLPLIVAFWVAGAIALGFPAVQEVLITEQEREFMRRPKAYLRKIGDTVLVADVYPGDWVRVCAWSVDDEFWKLSFVDSDGTQEYHRIHFSETHLTDVRLQDKSASCASKEAARFVVIGDFTARKAVHPKARVSTDFLELTFTDEGDR